jgi:DHA1 family multidrug resistance protein-like MFS transporter
MAAQIAHPGPDLYAHLTRTAVQGASTMNPESPQKSAEHLTASSNGNSIPDMEKAPEKDADAPVVDEFLVEFSGPDDPDNPKNWTTGRRWGITVVVGLLVFTVTFASSIFSVNIGIVEEKFHVTQVVATLGVALFVLVRRPHECV